MIQHYLRTTALAAVIGAASLAYAPAASAALLFDQNVTPDVIFGSGNANGSFTVDRSNNVELGLRGKLRHNASGAPENTFNSNGDGTYSFDAGIAPTQSFPTAVWSFEWSINSDLNHNPSGTEPARPLNAFTYQLGLDTDPSVGTNFQLIFDPINDIEPLAGVVCWDHDTGNNATGNGGGTRVPSGNCRSGDPTVQNQAVTDYAAKIAADNVAQNSWKPHWFLASFGFDPEVDATYDIFLAAFDGDDEVARTSIQIIVGQGGTPAEVAEPATLAVLGLGLAGLGLAARRRRLA